MARPEYQTVEWIRISDCRMDQNPKTDSDPFTNGITRPKGRNR